jgi:hypothetical protein
MRSREAKCFVLEGQDEGARFPRFLHTLLGHEEVELTRALANRLVSVIPTGYSAVRVRFALFLLEEIYIGWTISSRIEEQEPAFAGAASARRNVA